MSSVPLGRVIETAQQSPQVDKGKNTTHNISTKVTNGSLISDHTDQGAVVPCCTHLNVPQKLVVLLVGTVLVKDLQWKSLVQKEDSAPFTTYDLVNITRMFGLVINLLMPLCKG